MKLSTSNKAGFTLVEIMIVVAIIGLLAAIAIPNFVKARQSSQRNACMANLKQMDGAKDVGRPSLDRILIRATDQRLRRQMEHNFRANLLDRTGDTATAVTVFACPVCRAICKNPRVTAQIAARWLRAKGQSLV